MQPKFLALVPLVSLLASFVAAYPSIDAAALMERGYDEGEGLMFAREYDFADALEMRDFDELEMRAFDDELETRDFDDELEMRGFDDDLLEMREFDELDARDLEDLLERGLFSKSTPEEKKQKEEEKKRKALIKASRTEQKTIDKANAKSSLSIQCINCGSWEGKITARIQKAWKSDANIKKFENCQATTKDYNGGQMITARYYNGNNLLTFVAQPRAPQFGTSLSSSITMRIATFNIRYDCKPDNISIQQSLDALLNTDPLKEVAFQSLKGEQPWSARRIRVANHILDEGAILAAFQEALFRQVTDVAELLGDGWAWERSHWQLLSELQLIANDNFWLSTSTGSDSGGYKITTGASPPLPVDSAFAKKYSVRQDQLPHFRMLDLRAETLRQNVSANFATFTGFRGPSDTSDWSRIDFIFGGSNKGWTSNSYVVQSHSNENQGET
ncbi:uncharacterized protein LACBIDRAFT_292661 [Laccaria bicolor S238N-H82]|uniref:Predicted protein n=1 Tax=Laccaria bicolor (strain S238N-H82 / ATCC MYA-4686) TaxID=486041 RepID=B0CZB6_LACBS|nr:uncharacterized protein LACBIDRAFT_292661 [Laccaria bicolor S238N-H82]EDR12123.1 predicted protein [Laccaria bicolor S238N-H82]|eukprot:XP_001876387.1 predicted protein [Laccaria bicolor S238N-H82]